MFFRIISICVASSLISCASTTSIRVVDRNGNIDRNVKVYVDGQYQGTGEVLHSDTKVVGSTTSVNLRKAGCQSQSVMFSRTERLSVGALIGGLFFWIPFLWIMGYNPTHNYEFQCEK